MKLLDQKEIIENVDRKNMFKLIAEFSKQLKHAEEIGKSFSIGIVIEANGQHSLAQNSFVWVVLRDTYMHYYLQNPAVVLHSDKSWQATNLHLGHDIIEIIFVKVTGNGNDHFLRKVKNHEWGAFDNLPTGTENLGSVSIEVK